jgi:hypothetical protein
MQKANAFRAYHIGLSLLLGIYLCARAVLNPLVFDEATTFFSYVVTGNFLPGQGYWSANNHYLNSFLSFIAYRLGGLDEWVLRFPNLLAFPLFSTYLYLLLKQTKAWIPFIGSLLFLFGSHYLIEFFAYSRGYGLMLAFCTAALFHLKKYFHQKKRTQFVYFLITLCLALASNLSLIPLAGLLLLSAYWLLFNNETKPKIIIGFLLLSFLPLAFASWTILTLKNNGQLYYGGITGFYQDSILSIEALLFGAKIPLFTFATATVFLFLIRHIWRWRKDQSLRVFYWPSFAFVLIGLFYLLAHQLIALNFPYNRALLYWLFMLILAAIGQAAAFAEKGQIKVAVLPLLFLLALPFSFFGKLSLKSSSDDGWSREQIPDTFYHHVLSESAHSVGGSYLQAPQWNYLQVKNKQALNPFQVKDGPYLDFRLCEVYKTDEFLNHYQKTDLQNGSKNLLLLRNKKNIKTKILSSLEPADVINHGGALPIWEKDQWNHQVQGIAFSAQIKTLELSWTQALVVQGFDDQGKALHWESYDLKRYLLPSKDWQELRLFVVLEALPKEVERLKFFLWNPKEKVFSLQNAHFKHLSFHEIEL